MKKIITSFFVLFLIVSCTLEHSNPLDPENSGIDAPSKISGIYINLSYPTVSISWNTKNNIDGYYIRYSFSEEGPYDLLAEIDNPGISSYQDEVISTNYNVWYKISAYIYIDENDILEGRRSAPKTWNN